MSGYITLYLMVIVLNSRIPVEIRTSHVSKTRLKRYRHTNLLGLPTVQMCTYSVFTSISEGKIKFYFRLLKNTARRRMGNGGVTPLILNIGTWQRRVQQTRY
jgi:hypothetical protein